MLLFFFILLPIFFIQTKDKNERISIIRSSVVSSKNIYKSIPYIIIIYNYHCIYLIPYLTSAIKTYKANPGQEDFVVLRNNAGKPEIAFVYR